MKRIYWIIFACLLSGSVQASWDQQSIAQQQRTLAQFAQKWEARKNVRYKGNHYRRDCSGFVQAVLDQAQLQWAQFARVYGVRSNGVHVLYQFIERIGVTHQQTDPALGDVVFFHNTFDRNQDTASNDLWTHIGIVTDVDRDGTITFHHYMNNRVQKGYLNLQQPFKHAINGKVINTYMRRRTPKASENQPLLAALLFADFGRVTRQ